MTDPAACRSCLKTGSVIGPPIDQSACTTLVKAVASEPVKSHFAKSALVPFTTTHEQLAKFQAAEAEKWGSIIKAAGIQPE